MAKIERIGVKQNGEFVRLEIDAGVTKVNIDFDVVGARHLLVSIDEALKKAILKRDANEEARRQAAPVPAPVPSRVDPSCTLCVGSGLYLGVPCQMCNDLFGGSKPAGQG
jgi:hypothetical protein